MTTYIYTEPSLRNQQVNVLAQSRASVQAHIVELTSTLVNNLSGVAGTTVTDALNTLAALITAGDPWDHVVRSVADLPAPAGGFYDLTSGSWAIANSLSLNTANTIRVPSGATCLIKGMGWNKGITAGVTGAGVLRVDGTAIVETLFMSSLNLATVVMNNANARLWLQDCTVENLDDGTDCISLTLGQYFSMRGGRVTADVTLPQGANVLGNFTSILLDGVVGNSLAALLKWSAGVVGSVRVSDCRVESNCTKAINWPVGNVPTQGMAIVGNAWNLAAPYTGIVSTTARVNMKANLGNAGLLTETAIAP